MDKKTYLKKLDREIRRAGAEWDVCYHARDWETLNQLSNELEVLADTAFPDVTKFKCYGLNDFFQELESHRKPPSDDPYDNRITHCYIECDDIRFEVRGWNFIEGILYVSAVNWSHLAGTCMIDITKKNFRQFKIVKE